MDKGPKNSLGRKEVALLGASLLAQYLALNGFGILIFVVPGALGLALENVSLKRASIAIFIWAAFFYAVFHRWSLYYGPLPLIGLILVRGIPWLLFPLPAILAAKKGWDSPLSRCLAVSAGYTLVCLTLLLGPTGNDWETPAACFASNPWCLTTLPWLGLTGFAFLIGLISSMLLGKRKQLVVGGFLLLVGFSGLSGLLSRNHQPPELPSNLKVALVQTGWSQEKKWDKKSRAEGRQRLLDLSTEGAKNGASLIIWPETAWPYQGLRRRPSDTRTLGRLARRLKTQILATSIEVTKAGNWLNTVSRITETGRFRQHHKKIRLAPFAEYIPLPAPLDSALRAVPPFHHIGIFVAGDELSIFDLGELHYAVLICFESQVPWMVSEVIEQVDFIVVVTNDAPMVQEAPKEYHFRSAILRAAQFRIPVLQASNNGVTGAVRAGGEVIQRTEPGFTGPKVLNLSAP